MKKDKNIIKFRAKNKVFDESELNDIFIEHNFAIMAENYIDNFNNINPEYLDENRLEKILNSDNILKNLKNYIIEITNQYNSDPNAHNASMAILYDVIIGGELQLTDNENIFDKLLPTNLSDDELYVELETHINNVKKVKAILNSLMIANFERFIAYLSLCKIEFNNLSDNEKIKFFKKSIDNRSSDFIKKNSVSTEMDFKEFNGGKVYINNDVYNENKIYMKPSRFLLRALKYDMVIVTHGKAVSKSVGNTWWIQGVNIGGNIYTNVNKLLNNSELTHGKKILLMICNPDDIYINTNNIPKLKNVDITYVNGFNKDSGYDLIFENVAINYDYNLYDISKYWKSYINDIKNNITPIINIIDNILSDNDPIYYSSNIECIGVGNGIYLDNHKCKNQRDFLRIWYNSFLSIINRYKYMVYFETQLMRHYNDRGIIKELYYTWNSTRSRILRLEPSKSKLSYKYRSVSECFEDVLLHTELFGATGRAIGIFENNCTSGSITFELGSLYDTVIGNGDECVDSRLFFYMTLEKCKSIMEKYNIHTQPYRKISEYRHNGDVEYICEESVNIIDSSYKLYEGQIKLLPFKNDTMSIEISPNKSFMDQYDEIHKVLQENKKNNNIEGMKHSLGLMFSLITMIERNKKYKNRDKEAVKARAFAINDFKSYLKIIQKEDKNFDFMRFYEENHYGKTIINIDIETIKGIKQIFKSILL